jgi:hypothetical protein
VNPPRPIGRQSAGRHDTVHVRMMLEALPPRMEDHETANRRAQAFRVGRDLQRRRRGPKQRVVHDALISQRETPQRLRHREDEVHVADGQELLLSRSHPRVAGGREALGTMAIPTAVVREADCAHWSQRSRCPPSAAVRHWAMARRMRRCWLVTQARCLSRKRSPYWRTMSATSKGGRVTACAWPRQPRGVRGREDARVRRTRDGLQMLAREMEIQHRVPDLHMARQELNRPEVRATLQQVRRIGMAAMSLGT